MTVKSFASDCEEYATVSQAGAHALYLFWRTQNHVIALYLFWRTQNHVIALYLFWRTQNHAIALNIRHLYSQVVSCLLNKAFRRKARNWDASIRFI